MASCERKPRRPNRAARLLASGILDGPLGAGTECRWARVLAYEPPHRFVISWDISLQWEVETDPARSSEIEVRFLAEGPSRTRVELEHRHLDRHGDGWEQMRDAVGSPNGWGMTLSRFAERVAGA